MKTLAVLFLAVLFLSQPVSAGLFRPRWTRQKPAISAGSASAVGYAKLNAIALSRDAAEDQARAKLLRLVQGAGLNADAKGNIPGARVTQMYQDRQGGIYVRLEVPLPAGH